MGIRFVMLTKLASALLLVSSFASADATRIGHTQAADASSIQTAHIPNECTGMDGVKLNQCIHATTVYHRRIQDGIPAACEGWKENKIQECIEQQALIGSILSQNNLDSIPSECEGMKTNKLGECLLERQTILDQNGVSSVPSVCQGLGWVGELEDCFVNHNTVQDILTANKLTDVPAECAGEDSVKLTECLQEWRLNQIILGLSIERIPPECEGIEKENELEQCLDEFTLAPTNYPTYNPTSTPTTYPPTVFSSYSPTASPVDWKAFATHIEFQAASEEEKETFNVLEEGTVAVPIGKHSMSLTTYLNTMDRDRRALKRQDGIHPRQYELDATRQHLSEVYEAEFHIPVGRVDLHFVDGGETAIGLNDNGEVGDGVMRHSTFFGNVLFVERDDQANNATYPLPTEEQLERVTLNAFTGEQKQDFIKKYHYEATGKYYFGIKYTYDVNVRKNLQPDVVVVPPTAILPGAEGLEGGASSSIVTGQEEGGGTGWGARIQQWSSSVESLGTSTVFIGLIMLAGVLLGTLIGLTAIVVRRKRSNRANKPQSRFVLGDWIDDEPDALGSVIGSEIGSDIESGSDMPYPYVQSPNKMQSSLLSDDFNVSQLGTSFEDSVDKGMEKETKEVDTEELDSGDSDSTWSFSRISAGSGSISEKEASGDGDR